MPSTREMRQRIRSVKNIGQITQALATVSASRVKKAMQAEIATRPYTEKAWQVLVHLTRQPGHSSLHPLLTERLEVNNILILMTSSDRGLAGAYNINIVRTALNFIKDIDKPVFFVTVGRKGRDLLLRRGKKVVGEFSDLPSPPSFMDVSAIGRLIVDDYLNKKYDQVYLAYTEFVHMLNQEPIIRKLLPLDVDFTLERVRTFEKSPSTHGVYSYEPDQNEILNQIVPRFTALQIYQSILSSQASEHAARMVAMRNATDNSHALISELQLEYNKIRQQAITNDMLDIAGGAEALTAARS